MFLQITSKILYNIKTKEQQHETFFKKKMNKSLLMYFSSILALHHGCLDTQYLNTYADI